ncbi:hypothetical protein C8R45DRAFT_941852 [Mycena sanguinolenta]|nr:hypothetical protein C8R45DRAFT_941852 [Mycena sanguinolenta]
MLPTIKESTFNAQGFRFKRFGPETPVGYIEIYQCNVRILFNALLYFRKFPIHLTSVFEQEWHETLATNPSTLASCSLAPVNDQEFTFVYIRFPTASHQNVPLSRDKILNSGVGLLKLVKAGSACENNSKQAANGARSSCLPRETLADRGLKSAKEGKRAQAQRSRMRGSLTRGRCALGVHVQFSSKYQLSRAMRSILLATVRLRSITSRWNWGTQARAPLATDLQDADRKPRIDLLERERSRMQGSTEIAQAQAAKNKKTTEKHLVLWRGSNSELLKLSNRVHFSSGRPRTAAGLTSFDVGRTGEHLIELRTVKRAIFDAGPHPLEDQAAARAFPDAYVPLDVSFSPPSWPYSDPTAPSQSIAPAAAQAVLVKADASFSGDAQSVAAPATHAHEGGRHTPAMPLRSSSAAVAPREGRRRALRDPTSTPRQFSPPTPRRAHPLFSTSAPAQASTTAAAISKTFYLNTSPAHSVPLPSSASFTLEGEEDALVPTLRNALFDARILHVHVHGGPMLHRHRDTYPRLQWTAQTLLGLLPPLILLLRIVILVFSSISTATLLCLISGLNKRIDF